MPKIQNICLPSSLQQGWFKIHSLSVSQMNLLSSLSSTSIPSLSKLGRNHDSTYNPLAILSIGSVWVSSVSPLSHVLNNFAWNDTRLACPLIRSQIESELIIFDIFHKDEFTGNLFFLSQACVPVINFFAHFSNHTINKENNSGHESYLPNDS